MINATTTILVIGSTGKTGRARAQIDSSRNAPTVASDFKDIALTTRVRAKALASSRVDSSPRGLEQEAHHATHERTHLLTPARRQDRACRRRHRLGRAGRGGPGQCAASRAAAADAGAGRNASPGPARDRTSRAPQPVAAPAPPPIGAPPVPEIANQQYGQGSGRGPLGFLRDAWHQAQDPYGFTGTPPGEMPAATPPPPGAGPAPQLPPGYQSLTDPASSGPPPAAGNYAGGPPLPEGYYPLTGPPPPGYFDRLPPRGAIAPVDPAALPPAGPIPPTP